MKISIEYSLKKIGASKERGHWENHVDTYIEEEIAELVLDEIEKSCEDDLEPFVSYPLIPSIWIEDIVWGDQTIYLKIGKFFKTVHYEAIQKDESESTFNNDDINVDNHELVYDTLTFDIQDIAKSLFAKSSGLESYPSNGIPWIRINSIQVRRDDEEY